MNIQTSPPAVYFPILPTVVILNVRIHWDAEFPHMLSASARSFMNGAQTTEQRPRLICVTLKTWDPAVGMILQPSFSKKVLQQIENKTEQGQNLLRRDFVCDVLKVWSGGWIMWKCQNKAVTHTFKVWQNTPRGISMNRWEAAPEPIRLHGKH